MFKCYYFYLHFREVVAMSRGNLSRISFHQPPKIDHLEIVLTKSRFLRTKKDVKMYKYKRDEVVFMMYKYDLSDEVSTSEAESKFLSYGTV